MIKNLLALLIISTLCFKAIGQTSDNHLSVSVKLSSDTISVCLDTARYTLTIVNDSSIVADSVFVTYSMKNGFAFTGTYSGAKSVNKSVANDPVFYIGSIAGKDSAVVLFSATVNCNAIGTIADTVKTKYVFASTPFLNSYITSSYNVANASIVLIKNNSSGYKNIGESHFRSIVVNNRGVGAIDTVILKIAVEPELKIIDYQINGKSIPYVLNGNTATITLADSLISQDPNGDHDKLLEYNEGIEITESYIVTSCSPSSCSGTNPPLSCQSSYTASWGCGGQQCESVSTNADVQTITGAPVITYSNFSNPKQTSLGSTDIGTTVFKYQNTGSDAKDSQKSLPGGSGMATNIKFSISHHATAASIKAIRINNISIDSIEGLQYTYSNNTYNINLENVTDKRLNIPDADGDGHYDDLFVNDFFLVQVDYTLNCVSGITDNFSQDITFISSQPTYFSDMCGKSINILGTDKNFIRYAKIWGNTSSAVAPADIDVGKKPTNTFTFCPVFRQSWYGGNFYYNCPDDSFYVAIFLPSGFSLATFPNQDSVSYILGNKTLKAPAFQRNDTVFVSFGKLPINNYGWVEVRGFSICFDINLTLTCNSSVANFGYDKLRMAAYHSCDANLNCTDWLSYAETETYHHCTGQCDAAVNTSSFTAERATFGWLEPPTGTYYTEATRNAATRITRDMADTMNIKLDAAYPADSVLMVIPGSIGTITTPLDCVMIEVSYMAQKNLSVFQFAGGTFEITDTSRQITVSCNVSKEVVVSIGNEFHHYVFIPRTCFPVDSFASGDKLSFKGYFRIRQNSINAGAYDIPKLRAQYLAITQNKDTVHSCDPWGAKFSVYQPKSGDWGAGGIVNSACGKYSSALRLQQVGAFLSQEDFPNEFRNFIRLSDTIMFVIPNGYEYSGDSASFLLEGKLIMKAYPKKIISTPGNDTIIFIEDWPVFDLKFGGSGYNQMLSINVNSTCNSPDNNSTTRVIAGWFENTHTFDTSAFITRKINSEWATFTNYKPALKLSPPPTQDVKSNIIKTDFKLCNNSTSSNAPYTWLAFDNPSKNMKLLYLLAKKSTGIGYDTLKGSYNVDSSKFFVKADTLFPSGVFCKNYTLVAQNTICNVTVTDSIIVHTGWQCGGFPSGKDSASCPSDTSLFRYKILPSSLSFLVNVPAESILLCDTVKYALTILNSKLSTLNNVKLWFDVSNSMKLENAAANYPASSSALSLPQPVSGFGVGGNFMGWDLNSILLGGSGLVGDTAKNKILLNMSFSPICGFDPNQFITFYCSGINPCGELIQQTYQSRLQLSKLIPSDSLDMYVTSSTNILGCNNKTLTFQMKVFNTGDTTRKSNQLRLETPYPLDVLNVSPPPLRADTGANGNKILYWMLPPMLRGDSAVYNALLTLTDTVCANLNISAKVETLDTLSCIAKALSCPFSFSVVSKNTLINACCKTTCELSSLFKQNKTCSGSLITFTPDTLASSWKHLWLFGDSSTSSSDSIASHIYSTAGTYTVTHIVSDTCGSDTSRQIITVHPTPVLLISGTKNLCNGESTTLTVSGATNYLWNTGDTTPSITINPSTTTSYSVTGTDTNACTSSDSIQITIHPLPVIADSITKISCFGNQDGTIDLTVTGGTAPYIYNWSTGATTKGISSLALGTYSVTVTDGNGCKATDIASITEPLFKPYIVNDAPTAPCPFFGAVETITAYPSGPDITYLWSTGQITQTISASFRNFYGNGGIYYVFVTNANGCVGVDSISLNGLDITTSTGSTTFCSTDSLKLTATSSSLYRWNNGDTTQSIEVDAPGLYWVAAAGPQGCLGRYRSAIIVDTVTCSTNNPDLQIAISGTQVAKTYTCFDANLCTTSCVHKVYKITYKNYGTSASACDLKVILPKEIKYIGAMYGTPDPEPPIITTGQPTLLEWKGLCNPQFDHNLDGIDLYILAELCSQPTGKTFVTKADITDNNGNTHSAEETQLFLGSFDPNNKMLMWPQGEGLCNTVHANDTLVYQINFQNVGTKAADLVVLVDTLDTQTLDISSIKELQTSHPGYLTIEGENILIWTFNEINLSDSASDLEGSVGFVKFSVRPVQGIAPSTVINNKAGIYFDSNDPVITNTVSNTILGLPVTITAIGATTFCQGDSVVLTASPANSYLWNTGDTTQSIIVKTSGKYSVIDASRCLANSDTISITVNPSPLANAGVDQTLYLGYGSQSIDLMASASGGTTPYTYSWNTGALTQNITVKPVVSTTYEVTVTGANGCSASDAVLVNVIDVRYCKEEKSKGKNNGKDKEKEECKIIICHRDKKEEKRKEGNKGKKESKGYENDEHFDEAQYQTLIVDKNAVAAHLAHGDYLGSCVTIAAKKGEEEIAASAVSTAKTNAMRLENFPNPFSTKTTIQFSVPQTTPVKLEIYGITGNLIETLFAGTVEENKTYSISYDAKELPSGVYFYKLSSANEISNKKMLIVR